MSDDNRDYDGTGPQRVKAAHLVVGVIFLGITAMWALAEAGTVDWHGSRYAVPVILLVAGTAGLIASLAGGRRRRPRSAPVIDEPDQPVAYDRADDRIDDRIDEDTTVLDRHDDGREDTAVLPQEEER